MGATKNKQNNNKPAKKVGHKGARKRRNVTPVQNGFGASVNALGWRGGYDTDRGLYIEKANAFLENARKNHPVPMKGVHSKAALERGENPFVTAWGGSKANGFGAFQPKKDTIEPFDEFVAFVAGSTGFDTVSFDVNPGNSSTFPQLSKIAQRYQRYNFAKCEFYYCPLVTVSTAAGKIVMAGDLEAREDAPPNTLQLMENNTIHADAMPYETFGFEIAGVVRHQESWFVRNGRGYPGGADPRLYDCATVFVGKYANSSTAGQGELRVRGIVELYDLVEDPTTTIPPSLHAMQAVFDPASPTSLSTSVWTAIPFKLGPVEGAGAYPEAQSYYLYAGWTYATAFMTCPQNGVYLIGACALIDNTTGTVTGWGLRIKVNGVVIYERVSSMGAAGQRDAIDAMLQPMLHGLKADDQVFVEARCTFSTGTTTVTNGFLTASAE